MHSVHYEFYLTPFKHMTNLVVDTYSYLYYLLIKPIYFDRIYFITR